MTATATKVRTTRAKNSEDTYIQLADGDETTNSTPSDALPDGNAEPVPGMYQVPSTKYVVPVEEQRAVSTTDPTYVEIIDGSATASFLVGQYLVPMSSAEDTGAHPVQGGTTTAADPSGTGTLFTVEDDTNVVDNSVPTAASVDGCKFFRI